jgi:transcriptional regulator with XRE-family HTH domain
MTTKKFKFNGPRLKAVLALQGISARRLSAQLGLSHSTVGHWISGLRNPSKDSVSRIEMILGIQEGFLTKEFL